MRRLFSRAAMAQQDFRSTAAMRNTSRITSASDSAKPGMGSSEMLRWASRFSPTLRYPYGTMPPSQAPASATRLAPATERSQIDSILVPTAPPADAPVAELGSQRNWSLEP